MNISRLESVPLRELWPNEARDFTTWLAENLDFLGEALGIELSLVEQEAAAGPFSADILAEDGSGNPVVIENQLEPTDHDHLGKFITYLSNLDAKAAVWITSEPRPERHQRHVAHGHLLAAASLLDRAGGEAAPEGGGPGPLTARSTHPTGTKSRFRSSARPAGPVSTAASAATPRPALPRSPLRPHRPPPRRDPANCDRDNLSALCAPCHLAADAAHHARSARRTRARNCGQLFLPSLEH